MPDLKSGRMFEPRGAVGRLRLALATCIVLLVVAPAARTKPPAPTVRSPWVVFCPIRRLPARSIVWPATIETLAPNGCPGATMRLANVCSTTCSETALGE